MEHYRVILDTNVILAAMRSRTGASHRLLLTIGHSRWQSVVTPALMYQVPRTWLGDRATRPDCRLQDITNILDLVYQHSHRQAVWFSWRPLSADPGDDAILEAAIAGRCDFVVSFNERHLRAASEFGIGVLRPADLLKLIGESK